VVMPDRRPWIGWVAFSLLLIVIGTAVIMITGYSRLYKESHVSQNFTEAVYFAVQTLTAVGFGNGVTLLDQPGQNEATNEKTKADMERRCENVQRIAIFGMVMGTTAWATLIAILASLVVRDLFPCGRIEALLRSAGH